MEILAFRDLTDVFDVNIKDPVRGYNIIYKDVTMCNAYIHLPLTSNQNADIYTLMCSFQPYNIQKKESFFIIYQILNLLWHKTLTLHPL